MGMPDAVDQISYEDLYARREQGNWRATEIDFSVDREQWQNEFSAFERHAALWNYAMFFHGEDAVTDALSPYIDAAPHEERKYFLATQRRRGGPAAAPASPQRAPGASGACKHPPYPVRR